MILTRVTLNPEQVPNQRTDMGRLVKTTVGPDEDAPRVLWARPARNTLIISSDIPPDWDLIPGATTANMLKLPEWETGQHIGWQITVEPVRSISDRGPDGRTIGRGKRTPLRNAPEVMVWFVERTIEAMSIYSVDKCERLRGLNGEPQAWHIAGFGTIKDPEVFEDLQMDGIGPGKARGAGLLLASLRKAAL